MNNIYHITTEQLWQSAQEKNEYTCPSLQTEGFIHCSMQSQVQGVLDRYYKGQKNLLLLTIDVNLLMHKLIYENAPSINQEFPHVYGPINLQAVINVEKLPNQ